MIFLYLIIALVWIAIAVSFTCIGVKQCKENNVTGLIWMFFGLSFLGLVIGYVLLEKAKIKQQTQPDNNEWIYDANQDIWKRKEN